MSEENVELARRGYEAFARGDLDAVLGLLDSHIEVRPGGILSTGEIMGEGPYRGHAGFLKYAEQWLEPWEEYQLIPEEFIDAGDRVVVIYRAVGRGKGSGIEIESRQAHVWTIRDGKAVRWEIFARREEALRAAGLREYAMSQENVEMGPNSGRSTVLDAHLAGDRLLLFDIGARGGIDSRWRLLLLP